LLLNQTLVKNKLSIDYLETLLLSNRMSYIKSYQQTDVHISQYVDWSIIPNTIDKICLTTLNVLDNYFAICISAKTYRPTLLMLENYKCFPLKFEDKPIKTKNTLSDLFFHMKTSIFYREILVIHTPACTRMFIQ